MTFQIVRDNLAGVCNRDFNWWHFRTTGLHLAKMKMFSVNFNAIFANDPRSNDAIDPANRFHRKNVRAPRFHVSRLTRHAMMKRGRSPVQSREFSDCLKYQLLFTSRLLSCGSLHRCPDRASGWENRECRAIRLLPRNCKQHLNGSGATFGSRELLGRRRKQFRAASQETCL